jgi:CheY-like chemotaxis protein
VVLAYVIVGVLAGFAGFLVALGLGASIWSALLVYSLFGGALTFILPLTLMAVGEDRLRVLRDRRLEPDGDTFHRTRGAALSEAVEEADTLPMRILAVDDDPFILELIPKIAAKVGCPDVTTASSGAQALSMLTSAARPFDCLLLDINMPEMDGIDLCGRIRSLWTYRDTPIIMLTAMSDIDHLDRAFRAGASDYTAKPFDIIEFGDRLKAANARIMAVRAQAAADVGEIGKPVEQEGAGAWASARLAPLADIPSLIEVGALQNYLGRLSGSNLTDAYVMAIVVERAGGGTSAEPQSGDIQVLPQVARVIDDAFRTSRHVMAYAGHGRFVVVANAAGVPNAAAVETALQGQLDGQSLALGGSDRPPFVMSVGLAVRPRRDRADRGQIAVDGAISLALDRAAGKRRAFRSAH